MKDTISRLEGISLFSHLKHDRTALEKIAALIRVQTFKPGSCIICEGKSGDAMYILNRGSVRVEKRTLADDRYTVVNLKDDMNAFFGEMALMDDDVRSASVFAITPAECYVIRNDDFKRLCEADPKIGYVVVREIAKSLAGRLRKTTADSATLIAAIIHDDEPRTEPQRRVRRPRA
jgi:CRP/FNR family transcriptional regulator, cyclic AMP receptor protein